MRRIAIRWAWLSLVSLAVGVVAGATVQAKPPAKAVAAPKAKPEIKPETKPETKPQAKPETKPAAPPPKGSTALRQDELLGRILAAIDKALAAKPAAGPTAGGDLAEALLVGVARSSLVAALHGHFALAGLGHSLRSGAMKGPEIAVMAGTMAQNYRGLAGSFALMAQQKEFDGDLAELWRSLGALAAVGLKASEALGQLAGEPADGARLALFDAALEEYRSRLQALMQVVQGAPGPP